MDTFEDMRPFSRNINKRPNKGRSHTRGRSIHPNEHTGISKQVIPANQLKNPTWDSESRQWIEGNDDPPVYEKESKHPFTATSEITGRVKDNFLLSRMVSPSRITPWKKQVIGPADKSLPYWRQPSYSRRLSHSRPLRRDGGRRTHKHKRKNKHTRRRRVQRRRD